MPTQDAATMVADTAERSVLDVQPETGHLAPAQPQRHDEQPRAPRQALSRDQPIQAPAPQVEEALFSEPFDKILGALAKAQGQFQQIEKRFKATVTSKKGEGSSYTYDFADLAEVLDAVRPALSANEIAVVQFPSARKDAVSVVSMLGHSSGQWIRNRLTVGCFGTDPQEIGSALSYVRRYGLCALLGVAPSRGEDDDGSRASGRRPDTSAPRAGQRRSQQPPAATPPAQAQAPAPPQASKDHVGKVASVVQKGGAILVTLSTGFKFSTRDAELVKAVERHAKDETTVEATTRPSADPSRYASILVELSGLVEPRG